MTFYHSLLSLYQVRVILYDGSSAMVFSCPDSSISLVTDSLPLDPDTDHPDAHPAAHQPRARPAAPCGGAVARIVCEHCAEGGTVSGGSAETLLFAQSFASASHGSSLADGSSLALRSSSAPTHRPSFSHAAAPSAESFASPPGIRLHAPESPPRNARRPTQTDSTRHKPPTTGAGAAVAADAMSKKTSFKNLLCPLYNMFSKSSTSQIRSDTGLQAGRELIPGHRELIPRKSRQSPGKGPAPNGLILTD